MKIIKWGLAYMHEVFQPTFRSLFYPLVAIATFFFFYQSLSGEISRMVFEQDLLWFMPNFVWHTQDLSASALIKYIFTPLSWYMDPVSKAYFFVCHSLFGLQVKYYIAVTLFIHACNSFLVYLLCRRAALDFRVSFFSGMSTFVFFAQLHAILWPMAFQHVIVVFFVLLGLNLYLKTDDLFIQNQKLTPYWVLSFFVNILATFNQSSVVVLPVIMAAHILLCSTDDRQKIRKLKLWLPVMVVYLGYPLFALFYLGNDRVHLDFTSYSYWPFLFFGIGLLVASFYSFKGYVRLKVSLPKNFEKYFLLSGLLLAACFVLFVNKSEMQNHEIGYSLLIPFVGGLKALLDPLPVAQAIPSFWAYHLIPVQISLISYLSGVGLLTYFTLACWRDHRPLLVLFVWYLTCYLYLVHQNPIRSRYFIYLAPIVSIILSLILVRFTDFLFSNFKSMGVAWAKETLIVFLFTSLAASNVLAIKLALFRGRLLNPFDSYEYIKAANLIKEDIQTQSNGRADPREIVILNAHPIPYGELGYQNITKEPTDHFFIAKTVFGQVFGDNNYFNVSFEKGSGQSSVSTYAFNRDRLERTNQPVDSFYASLDSARTNLKNGKFDEAYRYFSVAAERRPFLFRYLLSGMNFDDLRWISQGASLNDWFQEVKRSNQYPGTKLNSNAERIFDNLQREIDAMAECLFYLAYLENHFGNKEKEIGWITQLKLVETNYERLQNRLISAPEEISDESVRRYREEASDFFSYKDWNVYYTFYAFERFLTRLTTSSFQWPWIGN